jgi:hypothetical protein
LVEFNPVGITGHQSLTPSTCKLIAIAVKEYFQRQRLAVAVTSLAAGADQICAQAMLDLGGRIIVVLPARDYELTFKRQDDLQGFRRQLSSADRVIEMPFDNASEEAYWAAGQEVVNQSAQVVAIWDGQPAAGLGGTGAAVRYARSIGRAVHIIWPEGASRA